VFGRLDDQFEARVRLGMRLMEEGRARSRVEALRGVEPGGKTAPSSPPWVSPFDFPAKVKKRIKTKTPSAGRRSAFRVSDFVWYATSRQPYYCTGTQGRAMRRARRIFELSPS